MSIENSSHARNAVLTLVLMKIMTGCVSQDETPTPDDDDADIPVEENTDFAHTPGDTSSTTAPAPEEPDPFAIPPAPDSLPPVAVYDYPSLREVPADSTCAWAEQKHWGGRRRYIAGDLLDDDGEFNHDPEALERCYPKVIEDWETILEEALDNMLSTGTTYRHGAETLPISILVAYGVLQAGNNPAFDRWEGCSRSLRRKVLPIIYKSPKLQEELYDWAMPVTQQRFSWLSREEQLAYMAILDHARKYLRTFDYHKEVEYYEGLAGEWCEDEDWYDQNGEDHSEDCTRYFTSHGPDDDRNSKSSNPYRKIEAWIFRRANRGEMSPATMLKWVEKAIADLTPLITPEQPADVQQAPVPEQHTSRLPKDLPGAKIQGPQNPHRGHDTRGAIRQIMRRG